MNKINFDKVIVAMIIVSVIISAIILSRKSTNDTFTKEEVKSNKSNEVVNNFEPTTPPTSGITNQVYEYLIHTDSLEITQVNIYKVSKGDDTIEDESDIIEESIENKNPIQYYRYVSDDGEILELDHDLQEFTYQTCVDYGIEEYYVVILAQMCKESGYDPDVISSTNDYGLMQINKSNHNWISEDLGITDFLDPESSILAGVYIMSINLDSNDISTALSQYNTGQPYSSTRYSRDVLDNYVPCMELVK